MSATPASHLSFTEEDNLVEHVEDLQARLVDGEDDGAIGLGQLVQHGQEVKGGRGV